MKLAPMVIIAIITGLSIIWAEKMVWGLFLFFSTFLVYMAISLKKHIAQVNASFLYFIVFTIPIPFLLRFGDKDAMTVTTLLIFVLSVMVLISDHQKSAKNAKGVKIFYLIPLAIMANMTVSFTINPFPLESSIRYLAANISGIFLYFLILNLINKEADFLTCINIFLFSLIIQSVASLLQLRYPEFARHIILPFATRIETGYAPSVEGIIRATGIIGDYELLADIFLVGAILSMSLIYWTKKYWYAVPLFCCTAGIIFTKTRSSIIILLLSFFFIYLSLSVLRKDSKKISIKILVLKFIFVVLLCLFFPKEIAYLGSRLDAYIHSENLVSAKSINRERVWRIGTNEFLRKPSLMGKGMYDISSYASAGTNFHSLYLTLLFKIGILGLVLHGILWFVMLKNSFFELLKNRTKKNWYLLFFVSLSLVAMLIDGIKIEYVRSAQAIQFAWFLYGLLVVLIIRKWNLQ